jgi:hypothetical protein
LTGGRDRAHHVTRILFVAITMPMLARREARRQKKTAQGK